MKYIDTSVIVSALDPADPSNINSIEILKKPEKVISELVIAELNSVLLRNRNFVSLMGELSGDRNSSSYAAITYILQEFDVLYLPTQQIQIETPIGRYSNIMAFAIELASKVPMRTLDLLHLSYALSIANLTRSGIEFVTRDREFEIYDSRNK
ncbi:PilT domain-containing protein [mine drainage metagenome]|uniref:PilT domain-containing protein n=1 Tax=mine drainage metagenome TaxID=410659 RepID=T1A9C5_9ZZZZ